MQGTTAEPIAKPRSTPAALHNVISIPWPLVIAVIVLALGFAKPLYHLFRFAIKESFYSHILLIPFISGYLIWIDRKTLPQVARGAIGPALIPAAGAIVLLAVYFGAFRGLVLPAADALFWTISPFCLLLAASVLFFGGTEFTRAILFPLAFFFFITPFPDATTNALEIASQKASADVYSWMIAATGTPFLRDGQTFLLPGLPLTIAQECSGIRSSFVLLLTSLLAGHMFLRSAWKKGVLAFFVIPLGVVRNGFRVLVLSILTIHWDPNVIHSPLHHRGGPIFFALSLIPFFLFLFWLRKTERAPAAPSKN